MKRVMVILSGYDSCRCKKNQACMNIDSVMEMPNIWEHEYTHDGQKKKYKTQLKDYSPDDYDPDIPSVYINIRTELDKKLNDFLDAYHINPLIPMRVEVAGKPFKISMGTNDCIEIERLEEDKGHQGYGHL